MMMLINNRENIRQSLFYYLSFATFALGFPILFFSDLLLFNPQYNLSKLTILSKYVTLHHVIPWKHILQPYMTSLAASMCKSSFIEQTPSHVGRSILMSLLKDIWNELATKSTNFSVILDLSL